MIVSYDNSAKAIYIRFQSDLPVFKTIEHEPGALVDLDRSGRLIGVEMLNASQAVLRRIAKHFHKPELALVQISKVRQSIAA